MKTDQGAYAESGNPAKIKECRRCMRKNVRGTYWIRSTDQRHIFQCDICGQRMGMGWTEASHEIMVEAVEDHERAFQNRERWQREFQEKFVQDTEESMENLRQAPDPVENFNEMLTWHP